MKNKKLTVAQKWEQENEKRELERKNKINKYFQELEYRKTHTVLHDANYYEGQINQSNLNYCSNII